MNHILPYDKFGNLPTFTNENILSIHKSIVESDILTPLKKIMSAKMKGTGCRIQISPDAMKYDLETMQGGSIWKWIKDKAFPWLKKNVLPALADVAVPAAATFLGAPQMAGTARNLVREVGGFGVNKPAKGSPEMKAKMAKLRAMRNIKTKMEGGSFRLN